MTRPAPRTYRSQVSVEKVNEETFIVRAVPVPLHAARVEAVSERARNGQPLPPTWTVRMLTTDIPRTMHGLRFEVALLTAAEWVGKSTGIDMKARFHGVQRTAMGQGRCPHLGKSLCMGAPEPGTVWCARHPNGRKVTDDARQA